MTFAPMDVAGRIPRLREQFGGAGIDALLVTSLVNVGYLTGFTGSAGMALVTKDSVSLFTDGRYRTQSEEQLAAAGVVAEIGIGRPPEQRKALAVLAADLGRLGVEAEDVSWATQICLAKALAGEEEPDSKDLEGYAESGRRGARGPEMVPTTGLVGALRLVKDPGELDRMGAAAGIADAALTEVVKRVAPGTTELELSAALDHQMRVLGAQDRSFETIVASGPHAAMPHARPTSRPMAEGELVVIDFGAVVEGYCSDMTRTFCVGRPRSALLAALVEVVASAHAAGIGAVAAGVEALDVDRAARAAVAAAGWSESFMHGTGHGVGLEIHEAPNVGPHSNDKLAESSVVTVEPGVYLPGVGGARIEDTVVVTASGCRALTQAPKEWMVV